MAGEVHRKAEMGFAEANRIMSDFGVHMKDIKWRKEVDKDKIGEKITFWYEGFVTGGNIRNLWVQARASSRDKFFGKAKGEIKPIEEIDLPSLQQSAYHCLLKEGVKLVFGLKGIPAEELEKVGVKLSTAQTVSFSSSGGGYKGKSGGSDGNRKATEKQVDLIEKTAKKKGLPEDAVANHLEMEGVKDIKDLPIGEVNKLLEWIEEKAKEMKEAEGKEGLV